jgi:adenylate kinase family enzyme
MIIGSPGSGKSTFARRLGVALSLPVIHLDREFWSAGWVETPAEQWRAMQQRMVAHDEWIIDGHYASTLDIRLARAQTVVFLDYNRLICAWGALKRVFTKAGKSRDDMPSGCPETLDKEFLQFMKFIWQFPAKERPSIFKEISEYPDIRVIVLKSRSQAARFINSIS